MSWKAIAVLCLAWVLVVPGASLAEVRVGVLTNEATDQLEGRVGIPVGEAWEVGALAKWFTEDLSGADWGAGGYIKMFVDPNASIPVADWLPGIGDWLELPETIQASSYLIGKLVYADTPDGDPLSGAVGAGFAAGPAALEIIYNVVETGEALDPMQTSGLEIWFGACLEF
ncbi:MAG TPA: hypothetical protein VFI02_07225 [Armatimonadota bacterium]|nr:hypothetical protein [Armatimonadota bacterium]